MLQYADASRPFDSLRRVSSREEEQALLLNLAVTITLRDAPQRLQRLRVLLGEQYQMTEIAVILGVSRVQVWRLRRELASRLEGLWHDWRGR